MAPRKAELSRWRKSIADHLGDFPRQFLALENAMGEFGEDFEIDLLKEAYETATDLDAYNRVQALERAVGQVQNFVADLSIDGVKLAGLELAKASDSGPEVRAFETLRAAGVIDPGLCRRLVRAQTSRRFLEHDYVNVPAGSLHGSALLVRDCSPDFLRKYRLWIVEFL